MTDTQERKPKGRPRKTTSIGDTEVTEANAINVEELVQANQEFNEENERLRKELSEAKAAMAKSYVAAPQGYNEAQGHQIGQDGTARFEDGDLIKPAGSTLDDPAMMKKLDLLKFDQDMVTVEIHEVADEGAEWSFPIWVEGKAEFFVRGQQKTVKRMFVEGLARAKKTGFRNQLVVDRSTGEQSYEYPSKTGLRYPFSVVSDPNPMGKDWLKAVLRQP